MSFNVYETTVMPMLIKSLEATSKTYNKTIKIKEEFYKIQYI